MDSLETTNTAHPKRGLGWPGWREGALAVLDLLAPLECAGCGQEGERLCAACQSCFGQWRLVGNAAPLPVLALDRYDGAARALVLAYKDRRRTDLDEFMEWRIQAAGTLLGHLLEPLPGVLVVPAPSGWRRRWRGALVAARLAGALAAGIRRAGIRAAPADLLRRYGGGSQAGKGARSRALRSRMRVSARALRTALGPGKSLVGKAVVLVDDVVTTGATLQAARREIDNAGGIVVAAVALAAVPESG